MGEGMSLMAATLDQPLSANVFRSDRNLTVSCDSCKFPFSQEAKTFANITCINTHTLKVE